MKTYLMGKDISELSEDEYTTIKIIRKGVAKENRGDWLNDHCFNVWVGDHMVKCGMLNAMAAACVAHAFASAYNRNPIETAIARTCLELVHGDKDIEFNAVHARNDDNEF